MLSGLFVTYLTLAGRFALAAGAVQSGKDIPQNEEAQRNRFLCGAPPPSRELLQAHAELADNTTIVKRAQPIEIDTWVHVVTRNEEDSQDRASDEVIAKQMQVLNDAFRPGGFSFKFVKTKRTASEAWSADGDIDAMGAELREGTPRTLNLYIVDALPKGKLGGGDRGLATLPYPTWDDAHLNRDGAYIVYNTLPGGGAFFDGEGKVAIHEVGHWIGLMHTFEGGCNGGDGVADTAAQAEPTWYCFRSTNSCPGKPGTDPINNHMNYGFGPCRTEFTAGQYARMQGLWDRMRSRRAIDGDWYTACSKHFQDLVTHLGLDLFERVNQQITWDREFCDYRRPATPQKCVETLEPTLMHCKTEKCKMGAIETVAKACPGAPRIKTTMASKWQIQCAAVLNRVSDDHPNVSDKKRIWKLMRQKCTGERAADLKKCATDLGAFESQCKSQKCKDQVKELVKTSCQK